MDKFFNKVSIGFIYFKNIYCSKLAKYYKSIIQKVKVVGL